MKASSYFDSHWAKGQRVDRFYLLLLGSSGCVFVGWTTSGRPRSTLKAHKKLLSFAISEVVLPWCGWRFMLDSVELWVWASRFRASFPEAVVFCRQIGVFFPSNGRFFPPHAKQWRFFRGKMKLAEISAKWVSPRGPPPTPRQKTSKKRPVSGWRVEIPSIDGLVWRNFWWVPKPFLFFLLGLLPRHGLLSWFLLLF